MPDDELRQGMRRHGRTAGALIGGAALLLNTACYSYLPSPDGSVQAESDARIELTADGSTAMQSALGPGIRVIEGRIRATDGAGAATVDIERLTSWDGVAVTYLGRDPVLVPRARMARIDVRTLDRRQSWITAGVIGGVFVVAVATALAKARSRASGDPGRIGGSPPDLRVP